eukprot:11180175-Lingulodinium_polyedra.AAC.1
MQHSDARRTATAQHSTSIQKQPRSIHAAFKQPSQAVKQQSKRHHAATQKPSNSHRAPVNQH